MGVSRRTFFTYVAAVQFSVTAHSQILTAYPSMDTGRMESTDVPIDSWIDPHRFPPSCCSPTLSRNETGVMSLLRDTSHRFDSKLSR